MASKRIGILAGGALAGALLLGTAGLVLAQDPTPSPTTGPSAGSGMMGGSGMTGESGMMGGSGMTGGQMGQANLTPEQLEKMNALHDQMVASGTCDQAQMQQFHEQLQSGN